MLNSAASPSCCTTMLVSCTVQVQLKGHRSVGGMRASIYNSMPQDGVQVLADFMADFQRTHS